MAGWRPSIGNNNAWYVNSRDKLTLLPTWLSALTQHHAPCVHVPKTPQQALSTQGSELANEARAQMKTQLEAFRQHLQDFAVKYKALSVVLPLFSACD